MQMVIKNKVLLIPDCHVPFESAAYDVMLKVAKTIKPDIIVIKGDYADFYSLSQHGVKDPRLPGLLLEEVACVNDRLDELQKKFPKSKIVFVEGNHEHRLSRFIRNRAVEISGALNCKDLFKCDERGIEWVAYHANQLYTVPGTDYSIRHEPYSASSDKATATKGMINLNHGHDHQIHKKVMANALGTKIEVSSDGWLGDKRHPAFSYLRNFPHWRMGFGLLTVLEDGNWFHRTIEINEEYDCDYNGKIFGL